MKICNSCGLEKDRYYKGNNVCCECFRARRYKHRRENPKLRMLSSAKHRAKKEKVPFSLKSDEFDIPDICPILGIKLEFNYGIGGFRENSPSLDKTIPKKGYVKGNVSVVSFRANRIKGDASLEELELLCKWMKKKRAEEFASALSSDLFTS